MNWYTVGFITEAPYDLTFKIFIGMLAFGFQMFVVFLDYFLIKESLV